MWKAIRVKYKKGDEKENVNQNNRNISLKFIIINSEVLKSANSVLPIVINLIVFLVINY